MIKLSQKITCFLILAFAISSSASAFFCNEAACAQENIDVNAPVITLYGNNPLTIIKGHEYIEAGYLAVDDMDGDISILIEASGVVDTDTVGVYELCYYITDSAGNDSQVYRTINVVAFLSVEQEDNGLPNIETATPAAEDAVPAGEEETATPSAEDAILAGDEETATPATEDAVPADEEETVTPAAEDGVSAGEEETATPPAEDGVSAGEEETATPPAEDGVPAGEEETATPPAEDAVPADEEEMLLPEGKGELIIDPITEAINQAAQHEPVLEPVMPSLSGQISNLQGAALAGILLRVDDDCSIETDTEGYFEFGEVEAGNHSIYYRDSSSIWRELADVEAADGDSTENLAFAIDYIYPEELINKSGTVTDLHSKEVIQDVLISFLNEETELYYDIYTDENGYYSINLPAGVYQATLSKEGLETIHTVIYAGVAQERGR